MNMPSRLRPAFLACLVLCLVPAAVAAPASGPFLRAEERSTLEVDLGQVREDLLPSLLEAARVKGEEEAQRLRMVLDLAGVRALDRLQVTSQQSLDGARTELTLTLDPEADAGVLGAMLAAAGGECRFARYVPRDEVSVLATLENLPANLEALLAQLDRPEIRGQLPPALLGEDGELVLAGMPVRADLLPLLAGEITLVMLRGAGDAPPAAPRGAPPGAPMMAGTPFVLAIAASDGRVLRDTLLDLVGRLTAGGEGEGEGGGEGEMAMMGEMIRSLPVETVGEFDLMAMPMGPALAASDDFLVLGSDQAALRRLLAEPRGDLKVPAGRSWLLIEGEALAGLVTGTGAGAGAAGGPQGEEAEAWAGMMEEALSGGTVGRLEVRTSTAPDRLEVEARFDGSPYGYGYRLLRAFVRDLPRRAEAAIVEGRRQEEKDRFLAAVTELDAALTRWGEEHDGTFPAAASELVDEGYLENLAGLVATPAGEYRDGGYTYIPLADADGRIVGYYFFIYGLGEGTGFDVFTPENLADIGHFTIGADGRPDGVAQFSYGGTAVEQMEGWPGH